MQTYIKLPTTNVWLHNYNVMIWCCWHRLSHNSSHTLGDKCRHSYHRAMAFLGGLLWAASCQTVLHTCHALVGQHSHVDSELIKPKNGLTNLRWPLSLYLHSQAMTPANSKWTISHLWFETIGHYLPHYVIGVSMAIDWLVSCHKHQSNTLNLFYTSPAFAVYTPMYMVWVTFVESGIIQR